MKKIVAAVSAGVLLIASQAAAAAGANSTSQVADRVGARADASDEMVGAGIPAWIIVAGAFVLAGVTIASLDDHSDSN